MYSKNFKIICLGTWWTLYYLSCSNRSKALTFKLGARARLYSWFGLNTTPINDTSSLLVQWHFSGLTYKSIWLNKPYTSLIISSGCWPSSTPMRISSAYATISYLVARICRIISVDKQYKSIDREEPYANPRYVWPTLGLHLNYK